MFKSKEQDNRYMVIYKKDAFDWDFKYCKKDEMLDFVRNYAPRDLRIYYAKDEINIDDEIVLENDNEVE